ncbi:FAD-dependent monooxygenase [Cryobacterium sp. BB307]|uniref:FAD-dependent monooxygenase n=1 Tax=Cryobacterium sp. BB307 TaxID=2716317 RepID=UPI001445C784|nr:FAD-dependent monooxygenase [Cryobacterium sp. BB307]
MADSQFRRGRTVLLGDAAHAMTPDLGQGGGQALEDAATLAVLLGAVAASAVPDAAVMDRALNAYDQLRRKRTQPIALASRRVGALAHVRGGLAVGLRDLALRATPSAVLRKQALSVQVWQPPSASVEPPA